MQPPKIASGILALLICGLTLVSGRIIERCQLVRELRQHDMPAGQIATWVCIAQHESSLNTTAIGPPNSDGSTDHGLFQVNDRWWCSPPGRGKGCGVSCAQLRTDDIGKSVACVKKVYAETQRLRGNGFKAWSTYKFCKSPPSVAQC